MPIRRLIVAPAAHARLGALDSELSTWSGGEPVLVIAPSFLAAQRVLRRAGKATFGWAARSLNQHAAHCAREPLAARGLAAATSLGLDAVWTRVVFEAAATDTLGRFAPIADRPGLVRAVREAVEQLAAAGATEQDLDHELATLWRAYRDLLTGAQLADRAELLRAATQAATSAPRLVFVDVPVHQPVERDFVSALVRHARDVVVTSPALDGRSVAAWRAILGVEPEPVAGAVDGVPGDALARLQRQLFASPERTAALDPTVDFLSAPGETREGVELVRRLQAHAAAGVPYERMAVLLRSPETHRDAVAEALRRAEIPAHFELSVRRPHASGRAFLALLACADERLSARRFAEYLSLAQVPRVDASGAPPAPAAQLELTLSEEAAALWQAATGDDGQSTEERDGEAPPASEAGPVVAGTLRHPRRWELLVGEAAVIGGLDRWRRRLDGYARKRALERQHAATEAQAQRLDRELGDLSALRAYALPLIEALASLPDRATWGEWLDRLVPLATRALRTPDRVLALLGDLAPLGPIGPLPLAEVRAVLAPKLTELASRPDTPAEGAVFVGTIAAARGLSFDVVAVPGLAERLFPPKLREDPLLTQAVRDTLAAKGIPLPGRPEQIHDERLQLAIAVGAARRALVVSYPRVEVEHARPRVPSFYGLEILRAIEGSLPSYERLQRRAERAGDARLGWPSPRDAALAIDAAEYDLAVLDRVLRGGQDVTGQARYLVDASPTLARALRTRFQRWLKGRWTAADGLVALPATSLTALDAHQLGARAYSPTALELFAACPYKFFLSAVHRLSPLDFPEAIEELGPLEKGALAHTVQFRLLTQLRDEGVDVRTASLADVVFPRLEKLLASVAAEYRDEFQPAIERVWDDGVATALADLREWLTRAQRDADWEPWRFELAFGLSARDERDAASSAEPVVLDAGVRLRGSIDLVERRSDGHLRATDYKTGRQRAQPGNVVGGGRHLQPALYALTLEKLLPDHTTDAGRLYYCTQVGGFESVVTPLDPVTRGSVSQVIGALRQSLERGFFPALPDKAKGGSGDECQYCDFRPVCGPDEPRRTKLKVSHAQARADVKAIDDVRRLP